MTRSKPLRWAITLLCFSMFLYFWGLGRTPFYTKGEPREAVEVWEEVHDGEWILPLRNGLDLPSKPPLFHWLAGISSLAAGEVSELSVRLPSAVLALCSVLLVFWLGTRKWGTSAGVYAAFITATNFEWIRAATAARVDMTLTAFLTAALIALDRLVSTAAPTRGALFAFYGSVALATLGKGPVGALLPALVALTYLALRGDLARLRRMRLLEGGALALVICGSWYALAIAHGGLGFVYKQLWTENFGRFFAAESAGSGHEHPFYYMIGGFFAGFAPWSFFALPLAMHLYANRRRLEKDGYLYPLVWFLVVFVFYSISQSKRTVYLLPIYPAAALLMGAWWQQISDEPESVSARLIRTMRAVSIVPMIVFVAAIVLLLVIGFGADVLSPIVPLLRSRDQNNLTFLENLLRGRFESFLLFLGALAPMILIFAVSLRQKTWPILFASVVALVASSEAIVDEVFQRALAEQRSFKPFMESVRGVVGANDRLSFYRTFDYGALFYARRHIEPLSGGFGDSSAADHQAYVLMWKSEWEKLSVEERGQLQHLLTSAGNGPKGDDALVFALVKPLAKP